MLNNISTQIQQLDNLFQETLNIQHFQSLKNDNKKENPIFNFEQFISKMKNIHKIIVNSLKLNEKIYSSLAQKQVIMNSGTNNFMDMTAQIDKKIQDSLKRTKQLYQDTVHQNQKARFLLEQFISPIRQQLRSKVDETTFTLQMKMLLDEYDSMGHKITYDSAQGKLQQQKRKTVNSQTLMFLRDQILPIISGLEQGQNNLLQKTQNIYLNIQQLNSKGRYLEEQLGLQKQQIKQMQKKVIHKINQKMNDTFIQKKLRQTIKSYIKQFKQDVSDSFQKTNKYSKTIQSNFNSQLQILKTTFSSLLANQKASQIDSNSKIQKINKQIHQIHTLLQSKSKSNSQISKAIKKLHQLEQNNKSIKKLQKSIDQMQKKLQKGEFNSLSLKDEDMKSLIKKLNNFDVEMKKIKENQKNTVQKLSLQRGQINGIRDLLSKKANFSDILLHIQNKVDKIQFKQLKQKVQQQFKWASHRQRNSSFVIKQSEVIQTHHNGKHNKSKSFFSPSHKQKTGQIQNESQSIKRFKLGFNNEMVISKEQIKKQYSKTQYLRQSIMNNSSMASQPYV